MNGLIVEGLTGAGKTSVIAELENIVRFKRYDEEATFDDFMDDLDRDRSDARGRAIARMARILDEAASVEGARNVLFERFHFSHVALDDDWEAYDAIDRDCSALGIKVVLLTIPDDRISARALYRAEYGESDWQEFVARYGSEASALQALERSQQRRIAALGRSRLASLTIETTSTRWQTYAAQIADWSGWAR